MNAASTPPEATEARHALALALARLMFAVGKVAVFHIGMPPVTIPVLML
jgi:hypothetical protein